VWASVVGGVAARGSVVGVTCAGRGVDGRVDSVRPDALAVGTVVAVRGNVGGGVIVCASVVGTAGVVVGTIVVGTAVGAVPGGGAVTGVPRATSIGRSPAGSAW